LILVSCQRVDEPPQRFSRNHSPCVPKMGTPKSGGVAFRRRIPNSAASLASEEAATAALTFANSIISSFSFLGPAEWFQVSK
jgi:hypothetical protein